MEKHGRDGNYENTQSVFKRLYHQVWDLKYTVRSSEVLWAIGKGLRDLGIDFQSCMLYLVEQGDASMVVRSHDLSETGSWRMVRDEREKTNAVRRWEAGKAVLLDNLTAEGGSRPQEIFLGGDGDFVRSLLEVPFSHGMLGLYSEMPGAFDVEAKAYLEQVSLILSTLFHRLEDLEALNAKERQLRQAQKLQRIGQLTAEMAHEINNPLTVVMGECNLLQLMNLEPELLESINSIGKAAFQAKTVSSRILEFVNGNKAEKGWLNFNRIVMETLELVRRVLKKNGIELREELSGNLPWIEAHAGQIQQVVLNLIQNSWDALAGYRLKGIIKVRTYMCDRHIVLEVEDNGPGIPADIQSRIFEPFFTTKSNGSGCGLGLSVCAGIAEEHGGELRLEPRLLGTCVVLQLPLQQSLKMVAN